eukprot:5216923-Amphidinium_carterae.1
MSTHIKWMQVSFLCVSSLPDMPLSSVDRGADKHSAARGLIFNMSRGGILCAVLGHCVTRVCKVPGLLQARRGGNTTLVVPWGSL